MSLPVILREAAEQDLRESYAAFEATRVGLGGKFIVRVGELLERIEVMPEMFGLVWQDVRAARVRRFRHVIYYVVFDDRVEVLAVLHGARDASSWRSRI